MRTLAKFLLKRLIPKQQKKGEIMKKFRVSDDDFTKSSWSKNNPTTCVLVAKKPKGVALRDSKDPNKQTLYFTHAEWDAFAKGVKGGEF